MYCRKCGKLIPEDARLCPYCGTEVIVPEEEVRFVEDGKGGLIIEAPEGSMVTISDGVTVREDGKGV